MEIKILSKKDNPLMKREEIKISLEHSGKATPGRKEIIPVAAKKLKAKEDLIIIDKIFTTRGTTESKAKVLVYKDKKDVPKDKLEKQKRRMEVKKKKVEEVKEKEVVKKPPAKKPEEVKKEEKPKEEITPKEKVEEIKESKKE